MKNLERKIGFVLLTPAILSVVLFILNLLIYPTFESVIKMSNLGSGWTGDFMEGGGGYSSATPIYLGLMAISGAILIREK
jgi:hypothetical protein